MGDEHIEDAARALYKQQYPALRWTDSLRDDIKDVYRTRALAALEGSGLLERLRAYESDLADAAKELAAQDRRINELTEALQDLTQQAEAVVRRWGIKSIVGSDSGVPRLERVINERARPVLAAGGDTERDANA